MGFVIDAVLKSSALLDVKTISSCFPMNYNLNEMGDYDSREFSEQGSLKNHSGFWTLFHCQYSDIQGYCICLSEPVDYTT